MIDSIEQIRVEQQIFTAAWNLLKQFYGIKNDDESAWEALVKGAVSVYQMGQTEGQRQLSKNLSEAIITYLDTEAKK